MTNNILRLWKSLDSDDPMDPLFKAAPILMHSIDETGVLLKVSQFWADKLGYQPEEMVGRKSVEFLTEASQADAKFLLAEFFRSGSAFNVEYDFIRKNGEILPVLMSAIAEYNSKGEFVRSLAVMFDNTEAKRASAQLRQKHRMDAIGELVGGVAHDFNNLLAVILGNIELLQSDPDDPERDELIESAMAAAKRGASLTQQLLSYGRKAHLDPQLLDLNAVIGTADRLVRRVFPSNIALETVSGGGLWKTHIDEALLETALLNVLNNARDAMPNGGRITIETQNVRIDPAYIEQRSEEFSPGRYVMLAVSDTGVGMDETTLSRVFEPFFTTKDVGAGSGLGLSMVFGFVRQSNGAIRAYSEPSVGTTIRMYFPAHFNEAEPDAKPGLPAHSGEAGKLILLAEDEADVRRVLVRQLADAPLQIIEAASGDEAYQLLKDGIRPDLLVTDIVMPGSLQGPELAERSRGIIPDLPVLFISGYPTEAAIHGNGVRPEDRQLIKPVSRAEFMRTVLELLNTE